MQMSPSGILPWSSAPSSPTMQKHPSTCLQRHQQRQASCSMSATTSRSRTWTLQHGWCAIVNTPARHLDPEARPLACQCGNG